MSPKKQSALYQWEQEMIDAYYDYQWHLALDPLYEQSQRWKAGELTHNDMDNTIHKTHKSCRDVYNLFTTKRDLLVRIIQFNEDWFPQWAQGHPQPSE